MTYSHEHGRRCLGEQEKKIQFMWKTEGNAQMTSNSHAQVILGTLQRITKTFSRYCKSPSVTPRAQYLAKAGSK